MRKSEPLQSSRDLDNIYADQDWAFAKAACEAAAAEIEQFASMASLSMMARPDMRENAKQLRRIAGEIQRQIDHEETVSRKRR